MKRLLTLIAFLLMSVACVTAQATKVPTCNGFNAAGAPIDQGTGSTVCTDYFGAANWAYSPLPAGTITGYTLISPGSGYVNPQVVIYLNRLSDLLFVLARACNDNGRQDVLWVPGKNRQQ